MKDRCTKSHAKTKNLQSTYNFSPLHIVWSWKNLIKRLPNTMMIKFRNADVAYGAMFWSSRFQHITSFAFVILLIQYFVIELLKSLNILFLILRCDLSWRYCTGLVINPETDKCQKVCYDHMNVSQVIIWHMFENARYFISDESKFENKYPPTAIKR